MFREFQVQAGDEQRGCTFKYKHGGYIEISRGSTNIELPAHELLAAAVAMHSLAESMRPIEERKTKEWWEREQARKAAQERESDV